MKNAKKIIIALCFILLFTTACGKVPKLKNGEEAVVTLKDGDISVDELYKELKEDYATTILVDMIDKKILEKKYKSDEDEEKAIENQIDSMRQGFKTEEEFISAINQYFGTPTIEDLQKMLALNYKRSKAVDDYVKSLIKEDEINKYYKEKTIGDMKISHILIKPTTTSTTTSEEKTNAEDEALKKAKEVITRLNNGEDFQTVAKEVSQDDGSKEDGGSLGWVNRGQSLDEDFLNAAIALEKGKYTTTPVKTQFGYHIIIKEDQREKPELKAIKDDIIETLAEEKKKNDTTLSNKALIELRKDNKMEIHDDTIKSKYNELINNLLKTE